MGPTVQPHFNRRLRDVLLWRQPWVPAHLQSHWHSGELSRRSDRERSTPADLGQRPAQSADGSLRCKWRKIMKKHQHQAALLDARRHHVIGPLGHRKWQHSCGQQPSLSSQQSWVFWVKGKLPAVPQHRSINAQLPSLTLTLCLAPRWV